MQHCKKIDFLRRKAFIGKIRTRRGVYYIHILYGTGGTGTAKLFFFAGWDGTGLRFSGQRDREKTGQNGTSRDKMGSRDFCFILLKITIHQNSKLENRNKN